MGRGLARRREEIVDAVAALLVGVTDSKVDILTRDYCKDNSIPATTADIADISNEIMRRRSPATYAYKSTDQTKTTDTTLADDSDLVWPVVAYTDYTFELVAIYESAAVDIKYQVTVPANATLNAVRTTVVDTVAVVTSFYNDITYTAGSSFVSNRIVVTGTLTVGDTAGNVALQWAQQSSHASGTVVNKPSTMTITKLS